MNCCGRDPSMYSFGWMTIGFSGNRVAYDLSMFPLAVDQLIELGFNYSICYKIWTRRVSSAKLGPFCLGLSLLKRNINKYMYSISLKMCMFVCVLAFFVCFFSFAMVMMIYFNGLMDYIFVLSFHSYSSGFLTFCSRWIKQNTVPCIMVCYCDSSYSTTYT